MKHLVPILFGSLVWCENAVIVSEALSSVSVVARKIQRFSTVPNSVLTFTPYQRRHSDLFSTRRYPEEDEKDEDYLDWSDDLKQQDSRPSVTNNPDIRSASPPPQWKNNNNGATKVNYSEDLMEKDYRGKNSGNILNRKEKDASGNFWFNPAEGVDRSREDIIARQQRRPPRRDTLRSTTTFRSGTPPPPALMKEFYGQMFWYDIDPYENAGEKTMFGGTKGKFDARNYILDGEHILLQRSKRRRQPQEDDDDRNDDYYYNNDDDGPASANKNQENGTVEPQQIPRRKRRRESASREYGYDDYDDDDFYGDDDDRSYDNDVSSWFRDDDYGDGYGQGQSRRRRRGGGSSSLLPFNPLDAFLGLNRDDNNNLYEEYYQNPRGQSRSQQQRKSKRRERLENLFGNNRRRYQAEMYNRQTGRERRRRIDFDNDDYDSAKSAPRRKKYGYPYNAENDADDEPPVADIDLNKNTDDKAKNSADDHREESNNKNNMKDTDDVSSQTRRPFQERNGRSGKTRRDDDTTKQRRRRSLSWEERALAIERVPPKGIPAWGPEGDLGVDARMKATMDALEDIQGAQSILAEKKKIEMQAREEMSILRIDTELEKKRLLDGRGDRQIIRDTIREMEFEIEDASRSLRYARNQVKDASKSLAELEDLHWAVLSMYSPDKAQASVAQAIRELEEQDPAARLKNRDKAVYPSATAPTRTTDIQTPNNNGSTQNESSSKKDTEE